MKKLASILFALIPSLLFATDGGDFMSSIGKIYVVFGVVLIIFVGIILFLVMLERKVSKLEKIIDSREEFDPEK